MARRRFFKREPRYKDVARNEAADLQDNIAKLSLWVADHQMHADPELVELFNRKIDLMLQLHDLCTEIVNYKKEGNE